MALCPCGLRLMRLSLGMELISDAVIWKNALINRGFQHILGAISAVFFAAALFSLFDGLQAKMRAGPQELDLMPGMTLRVSGPCPVKNPVAGDARIRWEPEDAPIDFALEGFFTGYWFGSGMWRGDLSARPDAASGKYFLTVSFRGASAQSAQRYQINLYADANERRREALSVLDWLFGLNPFIAAVVAGGLALLAGVATYIFGMRYSTTLKSLGLFEIYRVDSAKKLVWCLVAKNLAPAEGTVCAIISPKGADLGKAAAEDWRKGKLALRVSDGAMPTTNDLIRLSRPG